MEATPKREPKVRIVIEAFEGGDVTVHGPLHNRAMMCELLMIAGKITLEQKPPAVVAAPEAALRHLNGGGLAKP